jgi:AraC-like DNA-binding protein
MADGVPDWAFVARELNRKQAVRDFSGGRVTLSPGTFCCTSRLRLTAVKVQESSATSIAFGVGSRDLSHFERTFKKEFRMSPSRYRGRVRAGIDVPPSCRGPARSAIAPRPSRERPEPRA